MVPVPRRLQEVRQVNQNCDLEGVRLLFCTEAGHVSLPRRLSKASEEVTSELGLKRGNGACQ